jgi:hypothetical protein
LIIPESILKIVDLRKKWSLSRKFDLVVCLEVAEHLPNESADDLVSSLVNHGDVILFSAAVPNQGGQNHLNEQWPGYWVDRFLKYEYIFDDMVRPRIWDNQNIQWWNRQNIFVVRKKRIADVSTCINNVIHPNLFQEKINDLQHILSGKAGVRLSLTILARSIQNWFRFNGDK